MGNKQSKLKFQSISRMPIFSSYIDDAFKDAKEFYQSLQKTTEINPFPPTDTFIKNTKEVYTEQKQDIRFFDEQLSRWKKEHPIPSQRAEIERLQGQMKEWYAVVDAILDLANELEEHLKIA